MALSRFRQAKTAEEEVNLVQNAVPKSTQYKNKWAYGISRRVVIDLTLSPKCSSASNVSSTREVSETTVGRSW